MVELVCLAGAGRATGRVLDCHLSCRILTPDEQGVEVGHRG